VGLLFFQPLLGMLHHRLLRKKGYRTVWGYWHIWYGRILLILALVNGVLGFQLAANTLRGMIAYEVIAAVILLVYVTVLGVIYLRSGRETWSNIMKALNVLTVKLRTIMH